MTYFRPLGLVFGADARNFIAAGRAGALGGISHIGFTLVETIERGTATRREIVPYADGFEFGLLTSPRPMFGGLDVSSCRIMGIVNVTPDSFSDGGLLSTSDAAIAHGKLLADEGADVLDVGGESTRPGSDTVSEADEMARIIAVIEGLRDVTLISADTRKGPVMQAALNAGASIINDVSALTFDEASAAVDRKSVV